MKAQDGRLGGWFALSVIGVLSACPVLGGQDSPAHKPNEIAALQGHTNEVRSIAVTPDGKTLVSGGQDLKVKLWDLATLKERATLRGPKVGYITVAITRDGKTVAAADWRHIWVWDAVTGKQRGPLPSQGAAYRLAFSPDGRVLASVGHRNLVQGVSLWDVAKGKEVKLLYWPGVDVGPVAFSPDGRVLAAAGTEQGVRLWDCATGQVLATLLWAPKATACDVAFTPDGRTLAIAGRDEKIRLWELATLKERGALRGPAESRPMSIAFGPDSRFLASSGAGEEGVTLWDLAAGRGVATLKKEDTKVHCVVFAADTRTVAVAEGPDTTIRLWDVSGLWKARPPVNKPLPSRDLEALWSDLAGDDAARAYRAVWTLAGAPKQAAPWIARHLPQVVMAEEKVTAPLLAALDDDRQVTRDQAARRLEELGEAAWPALRKALAAKPSAEVRRRVEGLLAALERAERSPEHLRVIRAVEALELAGTPEARQVLEKLAGGLPQAPRSREARAALDRLSRRGSVGAP